MPVPAASASGRLGQRLVRLFLRGLLVLVPITLTASVVFWLFTKVDSLFAPFVQSPGLGLLLVLGLILLIGWISMFTLSRRILGRIDEGLEHTPGISFIYTSARDFLEAFAGNKRRFTQAVLVNVHAEEVWLIGFLTDEDLGAFKLGASYVAVYTPQAYNVAGQLFLVKRERVRPIDHLPSANVMKYAVTGGAVELLTDPAAPPAPAARSPAA